VRAAPRRTRHYPTAESESTALRPHRTRLLATLPVAALLTVATTVASLTLSAGAQDATPVPLVAGEISPALAEVPVDSAEFRVLDAALTTARATRLRATAELAQLRPAKTQLEHRERRAEHNRHRTGKRLEYLEGAISALAVASYTESGQPPIPMLDPAAANVSRQREVMASTVNAAQVADRDEAIEAQDDARRELSLSEALLANVIERIGTAVEVADRAARDEIELAPQVAEARVLAPVEGVDFPLVALDAYYRAAAVLAAEQPACGVRWWALAGISRVEGRHGTFGGATLDAAGEVSRDIIGIPLPAIGETDGGLLDGDPTVDRAVGPMQFIPSTWAAYGRDGNGDDVADPQNLFDATLSAATYLCASSYGLEADAGLRRAYFSYNHSDAYVSQVLGYARRYQQAVDLD